MLVVMTHAFLLYLQFFCIYSFSPVAELMYLRITELNRLIFNLIKFHCGSRTQDFIIVIQKWDKSPDLLKQILDKNLNEVNVLFQADTS